MESLPELFMDLAVILVTAGVITVVFKWLKQPLVLGYILAGFFIGPHFPWFPAVEDTASVKVWSDIGIVFLMFALGLEFSIKKLKKVGATGAITALTELVIMFVVGDTVGHLLGFGDMECIFIGCMLSISSTSIIIKSFDDLKLKQQKFASTVTAVLVVEDLIAVLLLVVLSTLSVSRTFDGLALAGNMAKLGFMLIVWFLFGIYLIPTFLRWMRKYMTEETLLIVSVGLCFAMVVIAAKAGFSTALGAFVMGAILAETIEVDAIHRLVTPLKNLFGAVFFVSVGMMVDPQVLAHHWLPVLALALSVIVFKSLAATTGVILSGRPLRTAMQSGFCFCQIGEFSFIIAGLGLSFGVISPDLYPIIVSVSILTTFVTPYMIKGALPVYDRVEPLIPGRVKNLLDRYARNASGGSDNKASLSQFIRKQLTSIIFYGVILTAIVLLSSFLLEPFLDRLAADAHIPQFWSRLVGLVLTLGVMTPFLWAVAVKNVTIHRIREMFATYRYSQAVVVPLLLLRYVTALMMVGFAVGRYFNVAVGALVGIAVVVVLVTLLSRKANGFYAQIEERFVTNFNSRQAQNSFHIPAGMEDQFNMEHMRLSPYSPLSGRSLQDAQIRENYGANVVTIERAGQIIDLPSKYTILLPADNLTVLGSEEQVARLRADVEVEPDMLVHDHSDHEIHTYRYVVKPDGPLCGSELGHADFFNRYHAMVIAIDRGASKIVNPGRNTRLQQGDILWFVSPDDMTLEGFESK